MPQGTDPSESHVRAVVSEVMESLEIPVVYLGWIVALVGGAPRESASCCANACRPCTLTIDRAVEVARQRLEE